MVVVCLAGATGAWGQKKANSTKNLTMEEMTAQAEGGDAEAQYKVGDAVLRRRGAEASGKIC